MKNMCPNCDLGEIVWFLIFPLTEDILAETQHEQTYT